MILGHGWRFLEHYAGRSVNVRGFDEHLSRKNGIRVDRAGTVTLAEDRRPVLLVAHEAVDNAPNTLSLLSVGPMQASNVQVDTTRFKAGVLQHLFEPISGRVIPLAFQGGMYRLRNRCPTDLELNTLPQVTLTSPIRWDPHAQDDDDSVVFPPLTSSDTIGFAPLVAHATTASCEGSVFRPHLQGGGGVTNG
jgi:hypothetical protein